jgi:hypothetical protein
VEVWLGQRMVAEMSADLLLELVGLHLSTIQLQQRLGVGMVVGRKPLAPAIQREHMARATERRSRRA